MLIIPVAILIMLGWAMSLRDWPYDLSPAWRAAIALAGLVVLL